mgnify:CR=1 FL=1
MDTYSENAESIERIANKAKGYAESIINTVRDPLLVLDVDLRVVSASRSFCQVFNVPQEKTEGQLLYDLGNHQWDIPKLRELLEDILPENTVLNDYEIEHEFEHIGKRTMLLNARQIYTETGKAQWILLTIEDVTERIEATQNVERVAFELAQLIDTANAPIFGVDTDGNINEWNQMVARITGYGKDEVEGKNLVKDYITDEYKVSVKEVLDNAHGKFVLTL